MFDGISLVIFIVIIWLIRILIEQNRELKSYRKIFKFNKSELKIFKEKTFIYSYIQFRLFILRVKRLNLRIKRIKTEEDIDFVIKEF
jgi:hypothetical protein